MRHVKLSISVSMIVAVCFLGNLWGSPSSNALPNRLQDPAQAFHADSCDSSLWDHVYHGPNFDTAKDRLHVVDDCVTVTGTVIVALSEKDGDYHIRLDVDPSYKKLLNEKNMSGQHGYLVVEPVCERPVSQADTLKEGVCTNFHQDLYTNEMKDKQVSVTGAYVLDEEHGWMEIHPVTSIQIVQQ